MINKDTAYALGSKKYIKRRTHLCSTRSFCIISRRSDRIQELNNSVTLHNDAQFFTKRHSVLMHASSSIVPHCQHDFV